MDLFVVICNEMIFNFLRQNSSVKDYSRIGFGSVPFLCAFDCVAFSKLTPVLMKVYHRHTETPWKKMTAK